MSSGTKGSSSSTGRRGYVCCSTTGGLGANKADGVNIGEVEADGCPKRVGLSRLRCDGGKGPDAGGDTGRIGVSRGCFGSRDGRWRVSSLSRVRWSRLRGGVDLVPI